MRPVSSRGSSHALAARVFHRLCRDGDVRPPAETRQESFEAGFPSSDRFFARLPRLRIEGRSVLDMGCGLGATCFWLAEHGASRVVGVDIQEVGFANEKLRTEYGHLAGRVSFARITDGDPFRIDPVDLVISKETFEHILDPVAYVETIKRVLAPGGELAIGFGPLWKAPWGGHISFMTRVPWAHLIFPEEVIMAERRRFRPDEDARCFEEILGGLNRMTSQRFNEIMDGAGFRSTSISINPRAEASSPLRRGMLAGMDAARRVPGLGEYFIQSIYGTWRLAEGAEPA